ncbi:MAG: sensor domain-containing diguanylate cyclase [Candidatus Omnitrophica bacterium]|nr:sensor domain-containing diguanylate cyclase [Candidatus Omnitrophota bacterium]MCM8827630.1 sensor domain-containing diguanylate cyclase [Candidatus Omnitrophota bacterium]
MENTNTYNKTEDYLKEIERLKGDLERAKFQFYVFYELTKAMRTTLRLDEIAYIILTDLTAHQGLGFNRALLFLINNKEKTINGFMGIGPIDPEEASKIWKLIKDQQMDLYALIENYYRIKDWPVKPKLMEFTRSLSFPLNETAGIIFEALHELNPIYIKDTSEEKFKNDPLIKALQSKELVIAPLWSKNIPLGVVVVDNYVTGKSITDEELKILSMFINQAAGAIENSLTYEDTLLLAHTDTLTSLWNYGYFQYKLDEEIMKANSQKYELVVMMIDIDDFKKFNDTFGHQAGDDALKKVANILKQCSRKIDIVCRYGGEEFALILPNTSKDESIIIAERIRNAIESQEIMQRHITVSIGVASFPLDVKSKDELIKKADLALYRAKSEGKNRVIVYS